MPAANKSLRTVFTASYIHEILLAQTKLESEGIRSFFVGENLNTIIGTAFVEGYKLQVDIRDFDKALSILSLYKT